MSIRFVGAHTVEVAPVAHALDNFGPNIVAVTFKYGDTVYTINKKGKKSIKGFASFKEGTYTLTNGAGDKMERMNRSKFGFVSVVYKDGTVETNDMVL